MSDELPGSALPGSLSPRNVDTKHYRVVSELPRKGLPRPGERFSAWPWGEKFAHLIGYGPVATNGELADWLAAGLIDIAPAPAQNRATAQNGG